MSDEAIQVELELGPTDEAIASDSKTETVVATTGEGADPAISSLKKQYAELKAKDDERAKALEVSRRSEADARAQADRASREVAEARTQIANSSFQSVEHEIAATESEIQAAKREYASAMETGEYTKAGDAQEKISSAAAKRVSLERDKATLDENRKRQTVVIDQQPQDPLAGLSSESRAWLQAHPECVNDTEKYYEMVAAHQGALKTRLVPDTPEYFDFIERRLGYVNEDAQQAYSQPRSRPMPAAPPSRDPGAAPGAKVSVNLSPNEVKSATDGTLVYNSGPNKGKPIGTQEMARRKALLQRDGKYSHISLN